MNTHETDRMPLVTFETKEEPSAQQKAITPRRVEVIGHLKIQKVSRYLDFKPKCPSDNQWRSDRL